MMNIQENLGKAFDVKAIQENLQNLFDVDAAQENMKKLFDAEAIQAQLKDLYNPEAAQANFGKLFDAEALKSVTESLVDQAQVEKSVKLASSAVTANTNVVSDAVTLSAVQLREGVEGALKQVEVLANCKDVQAFVDAQQAYAKTLQETLTERTSMNTSLVAGIVETNVNFAKEAFAQVKAA